MKIFLISIAIICFSNIRAQNNFEVKYKYAARLGVSLDYECSSLYSNYDSILEKPTATEEKMIREFIVKNNELVKKKNNLFYFGYDDEFKGILNEKDLFYSQFNVDSVKITDKKGVTKTKALTTAIDYKSAAFLRIYEEWYYYKNSNKLKVVVNGFSPVFAVYTNDSVYKGMKPMYWKKLNDQITYENGSKIISDTSLLWAQQIKFQIPLNFKEKNNYLLNRDVYNIKKLFNLDLAQILFEEALQNKIAVYDPQTGVLLDNTELQKRMTTYDSLYVSDQNGDFSIKLIKNTVDKYFLAPLRINQNFIFNMDDFTITSRINSIVVSTYNDFYGTGIKELFEVRFTD